MESEAGPSKKRSVPGGEYDVFLSFRGPDTGSGFTDYLYHSLIQSGVRTLRDDEELRKGEEMGPELHKAIMESRISIPIFSKNYASSKWCLVELQLMLECYKSKGQLILPIFYDVTRKEVKDQSGSYGKAFKEHEKSGSFTDKTIVQWKNALKNVGDINGWDLKIDADGYEGKLIIQKIVPAVLSMLRSVPVMDTEADADIAWHSSPTSLPGGEYEVFLSFSGPDTRSSFTDYLYNSLIQSRVRTLRDDEELRKGEEMGPELHKAIMESRISIPIFSKNYASSKWCLEELLLMLECFKSLGQLILPIFYDVTPEEVRRQSGSYGKAFKEHKKSGSFTDETIWQWKIALKKVAGIVGLDLTAADGYEGKIIIKKIVPAVLSELKIKSMNVRNLVGMDHHENEMMRLLKIASDNVQIVGIYGMSGIGKTTVAEFIYNKLLKNFDCCSFLADVQMVQKLKGTLVSLQNQLLSDTLNWSPGIANVDNGIAIVKQKFRNKKVLIVLDDVNSISQFHCLVGERGCFGKGSKIIVVTKNKGVLNALKVEWTYELPMMNVVQSLHLFSKHAFNMEFPPKEYVSISKEIGYFAGGLPLALKSVGSFLSTVKDPKIWEDASKRLTDDVWEKLRVDFEALNRGQQQIFLDIACLFAGTDKTTVFYMWDDCGYYPKMEFNDLYLMSLVKVGYANQLSMHIQLRALGKKIVNEEKKLGKRSRLWKHEDALNLLKTKMGTEEVEALSLCFELKSEEKPCFKSEEFTGLVNLRYLQVDGADLSGDFDLLSLRWLRWHGCPPDFNPTNFRMKNLVILDISNSDITEKWGGWKQIQMSKKLKVLQVAECHFLTRTPNFLSDAALEILILARCRNLKYIDKSIGNLKKLKVLDMSSTKISILPPEIWNLVDLEVMDFTGCWMLDTPSNMERQSLRFLNFFGSKIPSPPASISGLTQLQTLKIVGCTMLHSQPELPSSLRILNVGYITNLKSLVNLQELKCHNLVEMPRDIWKLSKLEKLTLVNTKIRSLPEDIGLLSQLKELNVQYCRDLQQILGLPSSLVYLSFIQCGSLDTLPDLSNLKNLTRLLLEGCGKVSEVQGLGELESLTSLDIIACEMLATFKNMLNLSNLNKLERLSIKNCSRLYKIQGLDQLESLKYLNLCDCKNLHKIEGLEALKSLEVLNVKGCTSLGILDLPCTSLEVLNMLECTSLEPIPDLPYTVTMSSKWD